MYDMYMYMLSVYVYCTVRAIRPSCGGKHIIIAPQPLGLVHILAADDADAVRRVELLLRRLCELLLYLGGA